MQVWLGQRTSADLNLAAQILILAGLWLGAYLAHRHRIRLHQRIQTTLVIAESFLILAVMITSFYAYVIAGQATTGVVAELMIVHGTLGLIAELAGIYLILRMSTSLIPLRLRVRNFGRLMRALLGLWTVITFLGFGIYYYRYLASQSSGGVVSPLTHLLREADDIQIHAEELATAAQHGNLTTARRHAEHLVNLIAGKTSPDYGDVDGDGVVEDPGDGTGALVYLQRVRSEGERAGRNRAQVITATDQVAGSLQKIETMARQVIGVVDQGAAGAQAGEILALAQRLNGDGDGSAARIAQLMAVSTVQPTVPAVNVPGAPGTAAVIMKDFAFVPRTLRVKKGTTVVFVNQDPAKHTATADNGLFNSGDIEPGQTFSRVFDQPGTFPYYCVFHGDKGDAGMAGTIIVEP